MLIEVETDEAFNCDEYQILKAFKKLGPDIIVTID